MKLALTLTFIAVTLIVHAVVSFKNRVIIKCIRF